MAVEHHWEVLRALQKGDGAAAREAIRIDLLDGSEKMLEFIAQNESNAEMAN
ncbi:hypothetical protein D9M71_844270 [compost metagenome]